MFKIEEYSGYKDKKQHRKTRLYQTEAAFERFWKAFQETWGHLNGKDYQIRYVAYKVNDKGQWEFVKEQKTT